MIQQNYQHAELSEENVTDHQANSQSELDLPSILSTLVSQVSGEQKEPFKNVLVVGMQHIMGTTVDMLSVMKAHGLTDAVLGGKTYSTHAASAKKIEAMGFTYISDRNQLGYGRFDDCFKAVIHRIWIAALEKIQEKKFDAMIILDDGAELLRATPGAFFDGASTVLVPNKPNKIVGIEQTRGGSNQPLFRGLPFPVINVAGAFVKEKIEYPRVAALIAEKILQATHARQLLSEQLKPVVGILGYGVMGKAVARCFIAHGFSVIAYDKKNITDNAVPQVTYYDHASVLIANADIIIGCSGADVTDEAANLSALLYTRHNKCLISTGSKDHEFNHLLRVIQNQTCRVGSIPNPLATIEYQNHVGATLTLLRGGFPLNFTNEAHSVEPAHIWPTRAMLLLACLIAVSRKEYTNGRAIGDVNTFMLASDIQHLILSKYAAMHPEDVSLSQLCSLEKQALIAQIIQNSEGIARERETIRQLAAII